MASGAVLLESALTLEDLSGACNRRSLVLRILTLPLHRIPSAFQGLYGLRPSYNRVPCTISLLRTFSSVLNNFHPDSGSANSMYGQEAIPSVLGPISSSVSALKIFIKAVAESKPWLYDPTALRLPWNEEAYQLGEHGGAGAKLCFAFMADDGVCKPMPPYFRAIEKTKKALIAAGHTGAFSPSLSRNVANSSRPSQSSITPSPTPQRECSSSCVLFSSPLPY